MLCTCTSAHTCIMIYTHIHSENQNTAWEKYKYMQHCDALTDRQHCTRAPTLTLTLMLILLHQPETTAPFGSIHRLCQSNYDLSTPTLVRSSHELNVASQVRIKKNSSPPNTKIPFDHDPGMFACHGHSNAPGRRKLQIGVVVKAVIVRVS